MHLHVTPKTPSHIETPPLHHGRGSDRLTFALLGGEGQGLGPVRRVAPAANAGPRAAVRGAGGHVGAAYRGALTNGWEGDRLPPVGLPVFTTERARETETERDRETERERERERKRDTDIQETDRVDQNTIQTKRLLSIWILCTKLFLTQSD